MSEPVYHALLLSKSPLNPDELHAIFNLVGDGYYTIKLSPEEKNEFWKFHNKLKGKEEEKNE